MGAAVTARSHHGASARAALLAVALGLAALFLPPTEAAARERYLVVIVGIPGTDAHRERFESWRDALVTAASGPLELAPERILVAGPGASAEDVRRLIGRVVAETTSEDVVAVVLIGHGTADGVEAKFNLAGPDLTADQWRDLVAGLPATLVFVNTTSSSWPFVPALAGPRRVVISATDTVLQRFDTVFPQFFSAAFGDAAADLDKDARISIGEAFAYAATRARRWYEQRGQLPTERAVLDDTGDGRGKEAGELGEDGALAARVFLDRGTGAERTGDAALSALIERRDRLETDIDQLKRKKGFMPPADYDRELERLLVELARLSRQIRSRS